MHCHADLSRSPLTDSYVSHYVYYLPEIRPVVTENRCDDLSRSACGLVTPAALGDDKRGEGVLFSDPVSSFHHRDGCGGSINSVSFFVYTMCYGNKNLGLTRISGHPTSADEIVRKEASNGSSKVQSGIQS